jgi:hypothetical protein
MTTRCSRSTCASLFARESKFHMPQPWLHCSNSCSWNTEQRVLLTDELDDLFPKEKRWLLVAKESKRLEVTWKKKKERKKEKCIEAPGSNSCPWMESLQLPIPSSGNYPLRFISAFLMVFLIHSSISVLNLVMRFALDFFSPPLTVTVISMPQVWWRKKLT